MSDENKKVDNSEVPAIKDDESSNSNKDPNYSFLSSKNKDNDNSKSSNDDSNKDIDDKYSSKKSKDTRLGDYLHELREESKSHRLRAEENEKKAEEARKQAKDALSRVDHLSKAYEQRLVNLEIEASARREGMINTDDIKLADLSKVKLSDDGTRVLGVDETIKTLKESRPYLFKSGHVDNTTTKNLKPLPISGINRDDVSKLNPADYKKQRADLLKSFKTKR